MLAPVDRVKSSSIATASSRSTAELRRIEAVRPPKRLIQDIAVVKTPWLRHGLAHFVAQTSPVKHPVSRPMSILRKLPPMPISRLARFVAVVAIAMAAGHLVQSMAARNPAPDLASVQSVPKDIVQLSAANTPKPAVIFKVDPAMIVAVAASSVETAEPLLPASVPQVQEIAACPIDLGLTAKPMAMIGVTLAAPCHAGERVVLRHAGLAVTGKLGADGALNADLPALMTDARVEILFSDGNRIDNSLQMRDAADLRRFGVQWQGPEAFIVHGFENGADYGQPGDVAPGNTGRNEVGALAVLGDATVEMPLLAQVYTFPAVPGHSAEVVIEASVTQANCDRELLGETISAAQGQVEITDLTLTMPECSGVGDFLVLKNLASDMKIAAN